MKYTVEEANMLTQMMKDLATFKSNHPQGMTSYVDDAVSNLKDIREFVVEVIKKEV